jgi:hypothetical protein
LPARAMQDIRATVFQVAQTSMSARGAADRRCAHIKTQIALTPWDPTSVDVHRASNLETTVCAETPSTTARSHHASTVADATTILTPHLPKTSSVIVPTDGPEETVGLTCLIARILRSTACTALDTATAWIRQGAGSANATLGGLGLSVKLLSHVPRVRTEESARMAVTQAEPRGHASVSASMGTRAMHAKSTKMIAARIRARIMVSARIMSDTTLAHASRGLLETTVKQTLMSALQILARTRVTVKME